MKGLKYTSTPKRNIIELKRNVLEFTKKLRLIEMLFSKKKKKIKSDINNSLIKEKSSFHPPQNSNACLDKTIYFLQQKFFKLLAIINQILPKLSRKIY